MFAISLESDAAKSVLFVGEEEINLAKNSATGLWQSEISIGTPGVRMIAILASDAFGNETAKTELGEIISKPAPEISDKKTGQGIVGAEIHIEIFDSEANRWRTWQAESFGSANPVLSDSDGKYRLLLPSGKYRLMLKKDGYTKLTTESFDLVLASFITEDFLLGKRSGVRGLPENMLEKITFR